MIGADAFAFAGLEHETHHGAAEQSDLADDRPPGELLDVGRRTRTISPAPNWTGAPLAPVTARLDRDDIAIDPHTATPAWRGERLDLHWAVSVLWRPRPDTQGNSG